MLKPLKRKISSTGYRLFFILQLLMQDAVSKEEILNEINKSGLIDKVSSDTIRLDINTLKTAGFEIITGDKSQGYKYFLNWNPIKIDFDRSEIKVFSQVKNAAIELCSWEFIINLYEVFLKISKFIKDEKTIDDFLNVGYFLNVDFRILKQLNTCCNNGSAVKILYLSPNSGEKIIDIACKKIVYKRDSKKLHLWGNSPQYNGLTYLRVDNILKIISVNFIKHLGNKEPKICRYRLRHTIDEKFKLESNEKITNNTPDYLEVESVVDSEFYFIQRVLSFGKHCFWVEDNQIRSTILAKLKETRAQYI